MKQFNINDYQGKYAMHCKTEEEAKDFCRVMHEAGRSWCTGKSYLDTTNFGSDNGILYSFNEGTFSIGKPYHEPNRTILNWSDFMQHEFTKADLRDGMVLVDRTGCKYIYLNEHLMEKGGYDFVSAASFMTSDLRNRISSDLDIVKVCASEGRFLAEYFDDANLTTIWQRPEVTVMTMDEIKKVLGIEGELIIKEGS